MKRFLCVFIALLIFTGSALAADSYPKKKLNGIIQWGAGGGTDSLMRPLCALAEDELGVKIALQNKTGGTGSVATQYVYDSKADGYTLLLGAENPPLYRALGISELTYDDFECVLLIGQDISGVVVKAGSEYKSFTKLVEAAKARPGEITLAATGAGGLPWQGAALIYAVTGAEFKQIPYESDAAARTAVLNGECECTICKIQIGLESARAGELDFLCMLSTEANDVLPEVTPVTDEYPDFAEYLPWGSFYGVFVKKGTDAQIISTLSNAFYRAYENEKYQQVLDSLSVKPLGLTGEAANAYIQKWSEGTLDALTRCGAV